MLLTAGLASITSVSRLWGVRNVTEISCPDWRCGPGGLEGRSYRPAPIALVTGAGRGIGRAIAERLSQAGLRVALTARSGAELAATAASRASPALVLPADITSAAAADEVFTGVEQAGLVAVLVANAGAAFSARLEKTPDSEWQRLLDINLTAPFRCVRRAVPPMRAACDGRIVVIASSAARLGEPYIAAYAASKHGVLGLVRLAAAELAGTGVTVNAVCPGACADTPTTAATVRTIAESIGRSSEQARQAAGVQAADRPPDHAAGGRRRGLVLRRERRADRPGHQCSRRSGPIVSAVRFRPSEPGPSGPGEWPVPGLRRTAGTSEETA